jgi:hypothetical protein
MKRFMTLLFLSTVGVFLIAISLSVYIVSSPAATRALWLSDGVLVMFSALLICIECRASLAGFRLGVLQMWRRANAWRDYDSILPLLTVELAFYLLTTLALSIFITAMLGDSLSVGIIVGGALMSVIGIAYIVGRGTPLRTIGEVKIDHFLIPITGRAYGVLSIPCIQLLFSARNSRSILEANLALAVWIAPITFMLLFAFLIRILS